MRFKSHASAVLLLLAGGCSAGAEPGHGETRAGTGQLALEAGEGCLVADEVVEHSCLHANFGPFESAPAQSYPGFVFTDISSPHTAFDVELPGSAGSFGGAVLFSPSADGEYAIFTTPGVPVSLFDGEGTPVVLEREGAVDPALCAQLERAAVFHVDSSQTYTVVFGPAEHAETRTLLEFIGDGGCEACEHVHLDASRSLWPPTNVVGEAVLEHPIAFEVPEAIPLVSGSSCIGTSIFSFRSGGGPLVQCLYAAQPARDAFEFVACTGAFEAGDDVEADYFKLRVNPGAALFGNVSLELELEDESCADDHDHEPGE
jgi:hypothetical protein